MDAKTNIKFSRKNMQNRHKMIKPEILNEELNLLESYAILDHFA
jgi:hypothetical protein